MIKDIRYSKEWFEIDGNRFDAEGLRKYCERQCSNGGRPDQYRMFFIGMIPTAEIERISDWKHQIIDKLPSSK